MSWPSQYGGQDASVLKQLVYNEEMAYWGATGQTQGADHFGRRSSSTVRRSRRPSTCP